MIRYFYEARLPEGGESAQSLYYFWVKVLDCPKLRRCRLISSESYIFARHAYPKRHPNARVLCPSCGAVEEGALQRNCGDVCRACDYAFDPRNGPASGTKATCPELPARVPHRQDRSGGGPSAEAQALCEARSYYRPAKSGIFLQNDFDRETVPRSYGLHCGPLARTAVRDGTLKPGYNTDQAINYGYQKLARHVQRSPASIAWKSLAERIRSIENESIRDLFACLFSGVLEFNNMFASHKGEGTGAVRHMFAHHILKPERTPLEANPWGTSRSSGAFSTLFERRLLRAMEYREDPFEITVGKKNGRLVGKKVFGLSEPIGYPISESYDAFHDEGRGLSVVR